MKSARNHEPRPAESGEDVRTCGPEPEPEPEPEPVPDTAAAQERGRAPDRIIIIEMALLLVKL